MEVWFWVSKRVTYGLFWVDSQKKKEGQKWSFGFALFVRTRRNKKKYGLVLVCGFWVESRKGEKKEEAKMVFGLWFVVYALLNRKMVFWFEMFWDLLIYFF